MIEEHYKPAEIAVVLLTCYPLWYKGEIKSVGDTDKVRGNLCLNSLRAGISRGYRMIVVESQSSDSFLDELNKLNAECIFRTKPTRAEGRRLGFEYASKIPGVKVILRTEPEKVSFIENHILECVKPIISNEADIVVPKRNDNLFKSTYPDYMYESEKDGLEIYNRVLREFELIGEADYFDTFFGPVVFKNKPEIVNLFLETFLFKEGDANNPYMNPEEYSNGQYFPIVNALIDGFRVKSVEIDFRYPEIQKQNEETDEKSSRENFVRKRKMQKMGILGELMEYVKFVKNSPQNRIRKVS